MGPDPKNLLAPRALRRGLLAAGSLLLGSLLLPGFATCQPATLARDIYPGTGPRVTSVFHSSLVASGSQAFFVSDAGGSGKELWKTDGTSAGTALVADVIPGAPNLDPVFKNLTSVGGVVFFTTAATPPGVALWRTDGTAAGTKLLLKTGPSETIVDLAAVGTSLFFFKGFEIWKSDGTVAGTSPFVTVPVSPTLVFAASGNTLFFSATEPANPSAGTELWKTDGTAAGTGRIQGAGSSPFWFSPFAGGLLFQACDPVHGCELWKSDGTEAGTGMVRDIKPGPTGSYPSAAVVFNGQAFFSASGDLGSELWKSDGTEAGTVLVRDINPGPAPSSPFSLTAGPNALYFTATEGLAGRELWRSDGTEAGTTRVADLMPGSADSNPSALTFAGSFLFFTAQDPVRGVELWRSDGTEAGTIPLFDVSASALCNLQGTLLFFGSDGLSVGALWKSDGTPAGTAPYFSFLAPAGSSPRLLAAVGGEVFFAASDNANGEQVWKSDGSGSGTRLLTSFDRVSFNGLGGAMGIGDHYFYVSNGFLWSIAAGSTDSVALDGGGYYTLFGGLGTNLYFWKQNISGPELWRSDGTKAGTLKVRGFPSGTVLPYGQTLAAVGATGFFAIVASPNDELWKTDGTEAGTVRVKVLTGASYSASNLVDFGGVLYFSVNAFSNPAIWKSDGTEAGTEAVLPLAGSELKVVGSTLYFTAGHPMVGSELWRTDGTLNGTSLVKDIRPGVNGSNPNQLSVVGSTLFFAADDGTHGEELWKTDGTPEGTVLVKDIRPGPDSPQIGNRFVSGGVLYFSAADFENGVELWKSDGSPEGTAPVANINPGAASSSPADLVDLAGTLFFSAFEFTHGRELWKSGGGPGSTALVKDIDPSWNDSAPFDGAALGGLLYFSARDAENGVELRRSDGTAAGTVLVTDLIPGHFSGFPNLTASDGRRLFFSAQTEVQGFEPFLSDGSEAGTLLIKDINPAGSSRPDGFVSFAGREFFSADDGTNIRRLWATDGTGPGTAMLTPPTPGGGGSSPGGFVQSGGYLFYFASAPSALGPGQALWRTDGTAGGTIALAGIGFSSSAISFNGAVFFIAATQQGTLSLWKSDGTPGGTQPVKTLNASFGIGPVASGGAMGFFLPNGPNGPFTYDFWKSDGTSAGTVLVRSGFVNNDGNQQPHDLIDVNGTFFFAAADGVHGEELWRSDGTPGGTALVRDIWPGPLGSSLGSLFNVGGKLVFRANDGDHGSELWLSDGTEGGTGLLQDINPGKASAFPGAHPFGGYPNLGIMTIAGTRVFFSATDATTGTELWSMPMSAVCAPPATPAIQSSANPNCGAVTLDAGPGYAAYLWSTGETTRTIIVNPSSSTTYTVYVSNAAGCRTSSSIVQMGNPVPAAPVASSNGPVCDGDALQLSASTVAGAAYAWTGPNGFTSSQQNPQIASATAANAGTYSVTVTVGLCTSAPATTGVVINPPPAAAISGPALVCAGQGGSRVSVPSAGAGAKYEWSITNGTITSGAGSNAIVFSAGGSGPVQLSVTVTSGAGCSAQGSVEVQTASCTAEAQGLVVDGAPDGGLSDGNGVLEPGETVLVSPSWKNIGGGQLALTGTASALTGPPGATYTLGDAAADYGSVAAGTTTNCGTATGNCYEVTVSSPPSRPAGHWDAVFTETLSDGDPGKVWPLHIGQSFTDVPKTHVFYRHVERLLHNGVTTGCGATTYCPDDPVFRLQMAVFLSRTQAGGDGNVPSSGTAQGSPYDCKAGGTSLFSDIPPDNPFCRHVHYIYKTGVTTGCEPGKYCPTPDVTRAQLALFVARAMAGGDAAVPVSYGPDPVTGRSYSCDAGSPNLHFTDVTTSDIFCRHIHYLWAKDVISGFPDGSYGPALGITRGAMAKFLANGFNLRLYGP